jgi:hypothetical protein
MNYDARNLVSSFPEIRLAERTDFLKVKETLTRIGHAEDDQLVQACHILHKLGRYYIVHWKEMKMLDGERVDYTDHDREVRNQVAYLINEWGLAQLVDEQQVDEKAPMSDITVIRHPDKHMWKLVSMHEMGKKRNPTYVR